ncbi:MAG: RsmE family RNA methyltransferase [Acidimicrobiales bacterium]
MAGDPGAGGPAAGGGNLAGGGAAAAQLMVGDLESLEMSAEVAHHVARVLRLRPGELVTAADGHGGWRPCRLGGGRGRPRLDPEGPPREAPRPAPAVGVAFSLLKGDRPAWVVQKLTEMGVDRIVPLVAGRAVVRWEPGEVDRHLDRLRRVAESAVMQSRRLWLPELWEPRTLAELAAREPVALSQSGGGPPRPGAILAVGPEGGWAGEELALGLPCVGLGPTVLRAETAALVVGALLCGFRAGLAAPVTAGDGECLP